MRVLQFIFHSFNLFPYLFFKLRGFISFSFYRFSFFYIFFVASSWEAYLRSRIRASQRFSSASTPHLSQEKQHNGEQPHQADEVFAKDRYIQPTITIINYFLLLPG